MVKKFIVALSLLVLLIPLVSQAAAPGFMQERMGTLSGQILIEDNKPLPGGIVSFINEKSGPPPLMPGATRVPDAITRVDKEGKFSARLVPGTYYIGALLVTEPGRGPGPPRPGEKLYYAVDEKKTPRTFTLKIRETLDVGQLASLPPDQIKDTGKYLTLEGTVLTPDGKPFPGAVALVKKDLRSMRPEFVSQVVSEDGHFKLMISEGTYYLMAREVIDGSITGQPPTGSHVGTYGVEKAQTEGVPEPRAGLHSPLGATAANPAPTGAEQDDAKTVSGKAGEVVKDLTIKVFPVSRPEEKQVDSYFKVSGVVLDNNGKPVAGMLVHAKEKMTDFRPPYTSGATDENGMFHLMLPTNTNYFLLAKDSTLGPPRPGTFVGFYGLNQPLKELLVFLNPEAPENKELFMQAKTVMGKNKDETVSDIKITVYPLGSKEEEGMITLPPGK